MDPKFPAGVLVKFVSLGVHAGTVHGISTQVRGMGTFVDSYYIRLFCDSTSVSTNVHSLLNIDDPEEPLTCERCEWGLLEHRVRKQHAKV